MLLEIVIIISSVLFYHTDTIPVFTQNSSYPIFRGWKNYPQYGARISTPYSTRANIEWKNAIGDANYNDGDIESINGVLWDDI